MNRTFVITTEFCGGLSSEKSRPFKDPEKAQAYAVKFLKNRKPDTFRRVAVFEVRHIFNKSVGKNCQKQHDKKGE